MELFKANHQWSTRPDDEKFGSIAQLHAACRHYFESAREVPGVPFQNIRAEKVGDDVRLTGRQGNPAVLTNWAFGQLCALIGAPAWYLRDLPATLAVNNLNHGLADRCRNELANKLANVLFHHNDTLVCRSINTDTYARIWNWEVTERLLDLEQRGWTPAGVDIRGKSGDARENNDLYASDHDMFAFLCRGDLTVAERASDGAIYKGVIVENSEVGASALKITRFLYREKCGNHIIWGASKVLEISVRHVGNNARRWAGYLSEIKKYADESVSDIEAKISFAQTKLIGAKKEDVLDALFGLRFNDLSKGTIEQAYAACKPEEDGDPRSVWGWVQGLTRFSQTKKFADERAKLDRIGGKVLDRFTK